MYISDNIDFGNGFRLDSICVDELITHRITKPIESGGQALLSEATPVIHATVDRARIFASDVVIIL